MSGRKDIEVVEKERESNIQYTHLIPISYSLIFETNSKK